MLPGVWSPPSSWTVDHTLNSLPRAPDWLRRFLHAVLRWLGLLHFGRTSPIQHHGQSMLRPSAVKLVACWVTCSELSRHTATKPLLFPYTSPILEYACVAWDPHLCCCSLFSFLPQEWHPNLGSLTQKVSATTSNSPPSPLAERISNC